MNHFAKAMTTVALVALAQPVFAQQAAQPQGPTQGPAQGQTQSQPQGQAPGQAGQRRGPRPAETGPMYSPDLARRPNLAEAKPDSNGEFVQGPEYANAPELTPREDVPKGKVHEFVMNSEDSKVYPGIARGRTGTVPYKRSVWVYVPAQYKPGTEAPFIVSQDAFGRQIFPTVLDNMIHDKRLPVMIAVLINSGGGDAQGSQRGLEYDTVSGKYAEFIETEVLPRIEKDYGVKFTKDPEGRATMGGSSGAAAAFSMAWFRPDLYRRVVSYSGTYVNQQSPMNPESPRGAWEYHAKFIPESERKPLRIWMQVSENDNGVRREESSFRNWVMANEKFAAALKAKGYPYRYVFSKAAGHTDGKVTRSTLPGALEWLWKGYPIEK